LRGVLTPDAHRVDDSALKSVEILVVGSGSILEEKNKRSGETGAHEKQQDPGRPESSFARYVPV
jgi:hypothetical protein